MGLETDRTRITKSLNTTRHLQLDEKSRLASERSAKVKAYDMRSKGLIEDHLRKQKVTQKLGLDYHIFEEGDDLGRLPIKSRVQTTKAAAVNKSFNLPEKSVGRRNLQTSDTISQLSAKPRKAHYGGVSPGKRRDGNDSGFANAATDFGIINDLDRYKARKEPIPFGMSEKIWDLDSYKDNFERY